MAEDKKNSAGKNLIIFGALLFQLSFMLEMPFLMAPGIAMFILGIIVVAQQAKQGFFTTTAQEINPYLPTSKGVDFLERVVGFADNPDTATMPIGAQPVGTHPTMGGVSPDRYSITNEGQYSITNEDQYSITQESYSSGPNRTEFSRDVYNEYADHEHEKVSPISDYDPVSTWYNPVDEWQDPVKYW